MKLDLENMQKLNLACGRPDQQYRIVHVAGTNGKGSVSTKIAKGLELAGYRVGLYTSPHISSFRERMRINGMSISQEKVSTILSRLFILLEEKQLEATFFELTTQAALVYFAEQQVDFAVLETGLGGRLDATNIVTPDLSVITSISLEHTEFLGNTMEAIAREKAGIIKYSKPVVIGPRVSYACIESIANALKSPLHRVLDPVPSNFERENQAVAQRAMQALGLSPAHILEGLQALPPCRLEKVDKPTGKELAWPIDVLLDVAHNPDGLLHLFQAVKQRYPRQPLRVVCGLSANKDLDTCLRILHEQADFICLTEANNTRAAPSKELETRLRTLRSQDFEVDPSVKDCVRKALISAGKEAEVLLICGSFFLMAEARQELGIQDEKDCVDVQG